MNKYWLRYLLPATNDFERLFLDNEYYALVRQGGRNNLGWLYAMLLLTVLALGFALGSLENLRRRMDDPFTNWLNLPVDLQTEPRLPAIQDSLSKGADQRFGLKTTEYWYRFNLAFIPLQTDVLSARTQGDLSFQWGRSIDYQSGLFAKIMEDDNLISARLPTENTQELNLAASAGIVVSAELLRSLGYPSSATVSSLAVFDLLSKEIFLLPVWGVVEKLPSKTQFVCSYALYQVLNAPDCWARNLHRHRPGDNRLRFWCPADQAGRACSKLAAAGLSLVDCGHELADSLQRLSLLSLHLSQPADEAQVARVEKEVKKLVGRQARVYQELAALPEGCEHNQPHYLAFNFISLGSIREFGNWLSGMFGINLPQENIESKRNFYLISLLVQILCLVLFVFALLSIMLFVNSLLHRHLQQIKPHLGTFKAFGLADGQLLQLYQRILFAFLLQAMLLALASALLLAAVEEKLRAESLLIIADGRIVLPLSLLLLLAAAFSRQTIRRMTMQTPGNLIYERKTK